MAEDRLEYRGRIIEMPEIDEGSGRTAVRVVIDGRTFEGGRDSAGLYYLDAYAFDRAETLMEVAKRYVDHIEARAEAQARARRGEVE